MSMAMLPSIEKRTTTTKQWSVDLTNDDIEDIIRAWFIEHGAIPEDLDIKLTWSGGQSPSMYLEAILLEGD